MNDKKYNRLIHEKSPYLLQHADNPVDWYPWDEAAFEAAREQDKPVFLSIGYSTCHWCHVMEHESFEDSVVAALMNDAFINIKVDREERPDVDDIYMTVCQMLTGGGGWPLTIIMTPDRRPFFAATYIPKEARFNRFGMLDLIPRIKELWRTDQERILQSAGQITDTLVQSNQADVRQELPSNILETAYAQLEERFDPQFGGFGERPKFPTAHNLMFLLRYYLRTRDQQVLEMVETTLRSMRMGGIYDHVGFGFHRYSTDERWLVPHFEKMLYDQAVLAMAYTETYLLTGRQEYRKTVEEILTYVLRDMTDAGGGFYSAEDADSEGEEGKFYLWTNRQVSDILGEKEAELYKKVYNFKDEGNFEDEATRRLTGTNIPHLKKSLRETAGELGMTEMDLSQRLERSRQKLFAAREKRVHPLKDDKILSDWNGLMIAAFCKAAQALDSPAYADAARAAADFILRKMRTKEGKLMHRYREGQVAVEGYLDDYAFIIWGFIELYETTFYVRYLQAALEFSDLLLKHFWDGQHGGFFFTADDAEKLLFRKKEIYDGAIPSGNSVMMLNLVRLGRITGNHDFERKASEIGDTFSGKVSPYPAGHTLLMLALDFGVGPSREIVIAGNRDAQDTQSMREALYHQFLPNKVLLFKPTDEQNPAITGLAEFTGNMSALDKRATAYVCQNYTCDLPTTNIQKMLELLGVEH